MEEETEEFKLLKVLDKAWNRELPPVQYYSLVRVKHNIHKYKCNAYAIPTDDFNWYITIPESSKHGRHDFFSGNGPGPSSFLTKPKPPNAYIITDTGFDYIAIRDNLKDFHDEYSVKAVFTNGCDDRVIDEIPKDKDITVMAKENILNCLAQYPNIKTLPLLHNGKFSTVL